MLSDQLSEKLVGSFDCKQGAVRALQFNGEYTFVLHNYAFSICVGYDRKVQQLSDVLTIKLQI